MEKIKITDMSPHNNILCFVSRLKNTARLFQVAREARRGKIILRRDVRALTREKKIFIT